MPHDSGGVVPFCLEITKPFHRCGDIRTTDGLDNAPNAVKLKVSIDTEARNADGIALIAAKDPYSSLRLRIHPEEKRYVAVTGVR